MDNFSSNGHKRKPNAALPPFQNLPASFSFCRFIYVENGYIIKEDTRTGQKTVIILPAHNRLVQAIDINLRL